MAFDAHVLDDIRAALKVSDVIGSTIKLIKRGHEFVAADDQSLTVNDQKGLWYDFGKGEGGGDIFQWMQEKEGLTFVGAVEELAKRAGITTTHRPGRSPAAADLNGHASASEHRSSDVREESARDAGKDRSDDGVRKTASARNEIVKTWDVVDPEGNILYQTVRRQKKLADGTWQLTKEGKPWKSFIQRRPSPDKDGSWVWVLNLVEDGQPVELMRYKGDWIRFDEDKFRDWKLTERKSFPDAPPLEPWLYNANSVIDELQEPREDQRTVFIPEGEACADVLSEWGLLAVSNTGGAKNFTDDCAEFFRGARHVVLLQDNDRAGAERVAKIAPMLRAVGVEIVQSLNFRDVWSACPPKGDVKDWRDAGGGTKDALLEIVDGLKEWTPEPYKSKFGAKTAYDLGAPVRAYPWRIKGILPMNDNCLLMGPSRSGKTFECLDMIMHVMNGQAFAGRKVIPGGFIYLTYEGATGFENRLRSYLKYHGMTVEDLHSFAWLTRPPNLFASEDNVVALASEIVEISKSFKLPLAGIIVDTHNSATRGSSEIKSDDMTKIMSNYDVIKEKTGAPLIVIGHTNSEGRHRGNEQFFNNIETAILIERVYTDAKHTIEKRDDDKRVIRRGKVTKQREGDDRISWEFVLQSVNIGVDEDGEPITQMVSVEPAQQVPDDVVVQGKRDRPDGYYLNDTQAIQFKAMIAAIENAGIDAPPELGLPQFTKVIRSTALGSEYRMVQAKHDNETPQLYANRIKASLNRFKERMAAVGVLMVREAPDPRGERSHFIWPTGRRVYGRGLQWPAIPKKKPETKPLLAPGETADGLSKDIF